MKIYTGYFAKVSFYRSEGLFTVGIARFAPKHFRGVSYKQLAPTAPMLKMEEKEYDKHFAAILKDLDPKIVVKQLEALSEGHDVVLLCYEGIGKRCHRHSVAAWFKKHGIECEEFPAPQPEKVWIQKKLF